MSETYFIDGYNLLHFSPEWKALADDDLEAAREALVDFVARWCDASGHTARIFFDGRARQTSTAQLAAHLSRVEVVFSSHHKSADSIIERGVYDAKDRESIMVVSADRGILDLCRGMGAMTMRPDFFLDSAKGGVDTFSHRLRQRKRDGKFGSIEEHLDEDQRKHIDELRDGL